MSFWQIYFICLIPALYCGFSIGCAVKLGYAPPVLAAPWEWKESMTNSVLLWSIIGAAIPILNVGLAFAGAVFTLFCCIIHAYEFFADHASDWLNAKTFKDSE